MFFTEEDEIDNLLELAGYDKSEEDKVADFYSKTTWTGNDADDNEPEGFVDIEKIQNGVRQLEFAELEVFSLWILNYSDSDLARSLHYDHETVIRLKRRIYKKLGDYYKCVGLSQFGARIVRMNKEESLDNFIDERLRQISGGDLAFVRLSEVERKVLKFWMASDEPIVTMAALNITKSQTEKYRKKLFDSLRRFVDADTVEEFIYRVRNNADLSKAQSTIEKDALDLKKIDFDEVIIGLKSLSPNQLKIFDCLKQGHSIVQIANKLQKHSRVVHVHNNIIFRKLGTAYRAPDKATLCKRIYQSRVMLDDKVKEHLNTSVNWNQIRNNLSDREWLVVNLWKHGKTLQEISNECKIYHTSLPQVKRTIVEKTKQYHGVETRREFKWLLDRANLPE